LGKTGETFIVNRDGIALNELRGYENAPFKLQIKTEPAIMAAQGKTGLLGTVDYKGEQVLAAYTHIERTGWGLVTKQNSTEVYAPIKKVLWSRLIFLLSAGVIVYCIAILIAKSVSKPVISMTEVAEKMQAGDFSVRHRVESLDEIGSLAKSFNNMADTIESQRTVQQGSSAVMEIIVTSNELQETRHELLKKLLDLTNSDFGAYYTFDEDNNRFEHSGSIGITSELLEPFSADILEGQFGKALSTQQISIIKDIPSDTVFKFKTFSGTALPKEIITIPLVVKSRVQAIITLASLNEYSSESVEILNRSWVGINTAISNLIANEQTRQLTETLNTKNEELQSQAEELQSQTEELQSQSGELQEQNIELQAQREQVEQANRLKSEFLSNMSHELRTPLNSILALSRVLIMQASDRLSAEEGNYLEIVERNGKTLLSLINDILDISKIEAGKMDISTEQFSLSSTIQGITERFEVIAKEKGIVIEQNIPDDIEIDNDQGKVDQVLQNLINNAVKFTEHGKVTISARTDDCNVFIDVTDTGVGVAEKELPFIFDEFRQVDGTSSRQFEGTGLGLAIVKRFTEMLGGNISVASKLGEGTTFSLTLPIKWQGSAETTQLLTLTRQAKQPPRQETILVVDDEPDITEMIAGYLSNEGYGTLIATSGREALELAKTHHPLAITLDVMMPEMDGWEVLQKLKENPETVDIGVVIVSISDNRETGFALGAIGHIAKPVDKEVLISEIRKVGEFKALSIMIVDDDKFDRQQVAQTVQENGMKAIQIEGGKQCIELVEKQLPDVLVLDLMMPDMDGFTVLEKLRSDPKTAKLPVIVVTAKNLSKEEKQRLRDGGSMLLTKSDTTSAAVLSEVKKIIAELKCKNQTPTRIHRRKDKTVLLVEDNESATIQVKAILENEGFVVDTAGDGQQALDYVNETIPDGIILDLMMPGIDGFEVLEKIRSMQITADIPVLVLTAKDLTTDDLQKLNTDKIQQLVQKGDVGRDELLDKTKQMLGILSKSKTENKGRKDSKPATIEKAPLSRVTRKTDVSGTPRVMVIEDNPDNKIVVRAVLGDKFDVIEAADGEQGLETIAAEMPDLVLLDMALPGIDGFAVVQKIRENEKTASIPVIAVTAQAMKGDREKTLAAGCDDYISKPFEAEDLLTKINKYLSEVALNCS